MRAKWTKACDRRLARLISHIHNTSDHRQYCRVGNTAQHCRLGFLKTQTLLWTLKNRNQHQENSVCPEVEHSFP